MAFSSPKRPLPAVAAVAGLCLGAVSMAQTPSRTEPISVEAASSEVDYRNGTVIFREVEISQGDISVRAQRAEATGLNFDNSRWSFVGNVNIRAEQRGSLRSDEAVVEFRNNRITTATVTGEPAEFEQLRSDTGQMARGRARKIDYEVGKGIVRLSENAWLSNGSNEISGALLVYNIREEQLQAAAQPGTNERVRITIIPGQKPVIESGKKEEPATNNGKREAAPDPKP